MPLTDLDRQLLQRCTDGEAAAWNEFVDRFLGVVYHVIQHACHMRGDSLHQDEMEDLAADVMSALIANDFKIMRHFRGNASLATYLSVISRRIVVNRLARRAALERRKHRQVRERVKEVEHPAREIENREEIEHIIGRLDSRAAQLIRGYYLEHKSYKDLSKQLGIPENSIGPLLARVRNRLKTAAQRA